MTFQDIDYLDIEGIKIPLKEVSKMKVFEEYPPVVLTDSGIYYWNWLSPRHTRNVPYKEITGIYQKIREDKDSTSRLFGSLGIIDGSYIYWLPPNEILKDSVIENVLNPKRSMNENTEQSGTNGMAQEIKEAMIKGYYKNGEYYLPRDIQSEIQEITGEKVHNLGKGGIILGYKSPFFVTEGWLALMDAGKKEISRDDIEVIPRNKAFYSLREVASNSQGPKSRETWLDIYNIDTQNAECPTPEITYQNFNRKKAIKLMTGKI